LRHFNGKVNWLVKYCTYFSISNRKCLALTTSEPAAGRMNVIIYSDIMAGWTNSSSSLIYTFISHDVMNWKPQILVAEDEMSGEQVTVDDRVLMLQNYRLLLRRCSVLHGL
jgi:hypothetical protein